MSGLTTMQAELTAVLARRESVPPRSRELERLNRRARALREGVGWQAKMDRWSETLANRRGKE